MGPAALRRSCYSWEGRRRLVLREVAGSQRVCTGASCLLFGLLFSLAPPGGQHNRELLARGNLGFAESLASTTERSPHGYT